LNKLLQALTPEVTPLDASALNGDREEILDASP
jgi:hypothetical protein